MWCRLLLMTLYWKPDTNTNQFVIYTVISNINIDFTERNQNFNFRACVPLFTFIFFKRSESQNNPQFVDVQVLFLLLFVMSTG